MEILGYMVAGVKGCGVGESSSLCFTLNDLTREGIT